MRHSAFSLVELLVSIAIVALLVGLLAPALSGVKSESRSMHCKANLRQLATAAHNYATMYHWFPPAVRFDKMNGVWHEIAWDTVTPLRRDAVASPSVLWGFTDNPGEVQQCPAFFGQSRTLADQHTGYNYNTSYLGGEGPFLSQNWDNFRPGVRPHACRQAGKCAMFGDGGWKEGANKFMRAPLNSERISLELLYTGGQAFRHRHQTNIAFVDGHVGSSDSPHRGKRATEELLEQEMGFPHNGFLSDGDHAYDPR